MMKEITGGRENEQGYYLCKSKGRSGKVNVSCKHRYRACQTRKESIGDSFRINVELQGNSITVTTHSALGVEDENRKRVQILLDSINRMHGVGKLFIGGESSSVVSFKIKSDFRELESLDNPFDLVFMGSSLIIDYSESIIKTLMGANIFYMRAFE